MLSFTEQIARIYCPSSKFQNDQNQVFDCLSRVEGNIRSVKLAQFYNKKNQFQNLVEQYYVDRSAIERKPNLLHYLHSYHDVLNYHDKLLALQRLADNPQVQKICIVGFGFGYSTLSLLMANPTASFLIFDNIQNHFFTNGSEWMQGESEFTMFNLMFRISLDKIIELFPNRIINVISGNIKHSLNNFNLEFFDKMDCNLLYFDSQQIQFVQKYMDNGDFLSHLRNSLQLLSPTYNRLVMDSLQLSNFSPLYNYYETKINEHIECPQKLLSRQKKNCLQKNLYQNIQSMTSSTERSPASSCDSNCPNIFLRTHEKLQGFILTPCIAYYSNVTDGLHIEFVFNYHNCQMQLSPSTETEQVIMIEGNERLSGLIFDSALEMIVAELAIE